MDVHIRLYLILLPMECTLVVKMRAHIFKLIFLVVFVLGAGWVEAKPRVILDITDDTMTMADEYALLLDSEGIIDLLAIVVTPAENLKQQEIISRLTGKFNRLYTSTRDYPRVLVGLKSPIAHYAVPMSPDSDLLRWKPESSMTFLTSFIRRLGQNTAHKVHYITQGRLSSLAYVLAQDKNIQNKIEIIGDFGMESPPASVLRDRPAWERVMGSRVSIQTWNGSQTTNSNDSENASSKEGESETSENSEDSDKKPLTSHQGLIIPLHPSGLSKLNYCDQWLVREMWSPFSGDENITTQSSWSDPLLIGINVLLHPDFFSGKEGIHVIANGNRLFDKKKNDLAWKDAKDGRIQRYGIVDVGGIASHAYKTFERWAINDFMQNKRRVVHDGDFSNGVTDMLVSLGLLYNRNVDLRGFTVAPFSNSEQSAANSLEISYLRILDFLGSHFQVDQKLFMGAPGSGTFTIAPRSTYFDARDFIIREASQVPYGERLHLIMTGPATNLALALRANPRIANRIHVWFTGAAMNEDGNGWIPTHSNATMDKTAFDMVMKAPGLKRSILVLDEENAWNFRRNNLNSRVRSGDGGWHYVSVYWNELLKINSGKSYKLSETSADFSEVAILETFLNPGLGMRELRGFSLIQSRGAEYWHINPEIISMESSFIGRIGQDQNSRK